MDLGMESGMKAVDPYRGHLECRVRQSKLIFFKKFSFNPNLIENTHSDIDIRLLIIDQQTRRCAQRERT